MMVETIEDLDIEVKEVTMLNYTKKIKMVYPKAKEDLIDFLNM